MSKRKVVGIPGFLNNEKMFGVTGHYMEFANKYGDVRILMPHEEFVEVDLLILPGGLDLSPTSYRAVPSFRSSNHDVFKEFFFKERLQNYVNANVPIFGICLGFQMLNVHFGGTLTQNLLYHPESNSRWATAHKIVVNGYKNPIEVNSHHHQGVTVEKDLSEEFNVVAWSADSRDKLGKLTNTEPEGTLVEAFLHKTLPIAGVQWHPEELYDSVSNQLITSITK